MDQRPRAGRAAGIRQGQAISRHARTPAAPEPKDLGMVANGYAEVAVRGDFQRRGGASERRGSVAVRRG